jgi:23S rRNA-/tRNA-specific pseudouridylate synthase
MKSEISILHHGDNWVVINKPPGLSVHNAEDQFNVLTCLNLQLGGTWFPVHRLDKETSGIMILASKKTKVAELNVALSNTAIKRYRGIVRGCLNPNESHWRQSLTTRAEGSRNPRGLSKDRVEAHTEYVVLSKNTYLTAVSFTLHTGRQHQLRKHAALNNHSILGDKRYGDRRYNRMIRERYAFEGMALQAYHLEMEMKGKAFEWLLKRPDNWTCFNLDE